MATKHCNFCHGEAVGYYPIDPNGFAFFTYATGTLFDHYGPWYCCERCRALFEAKDWDALTDLYGQGIALRRGRALDADEVPVVNDLAAEIWEEMEEAPTGPFTALGG